MHLCALLVVGGWFSTEPPADARRTVLATATESVLDPWASESVFEEDVPEPECAWWDPDTQITSHLCSPFSISRLVGQTAAQATERAIRCAAHADTECVLSSEVGLGYPAAWSYDAQTGMAMIAAPRIVDGADPRSVLVANPTDPGSRVTLEFNATITAEYMSPEHRAPQTRQLSNATAYCVQLLRHAFAQTCWKNLD